ncbi:MAG: hypothetical protein LBS39_01620, partial [Campylobacteraceae bacterium]|nr:hypothetical protein [Campylobacteraceae bacterium]
MKLQNLLLLFLPLYLSAFSGDIYYKTEKEAIAALESMGYKFEKWNGVTLWLIYDPPFSPQNRVWFLNRYDNRIWRASLNNCDSGRCIYHTDLISASCKKGEVYNKSSGNCEPLKCLSSQYNNNGVCTPIPDCSLSTKNSLWDDTAKSCICKEGSSNISGVCKQELDDGDEGDCKVNTGSYVIPRTREFHEDINIAGSDIALHYASKKVSGYKDINKPSLQNDIANGWSLSNVHHAVKTTLYLSDGTSIDYSNHKPSIMNFKSTKRIIAPYTQLFDNSHIGHEFNQVNNIVRSFDPRSGTDLYKFSYDSKENLISITDRFGRITKLNRDDKGKVTSITAPFFQITYLEYDDKNNLISISYEDGSSYKFTYNSENLLTSKTDPKNSVYRYLYNGNGRIAQTINPLYSAYTFDSYISNNISYSSFITPQGDVYSYINQKTDANGIQRSTSKNPSGFETTIITSNDKRDIEKNYCGITKKISYDIDSLSMQNRLSSVTTTMPSSLTNTQSFYTYYKQLSPKIYEDISTYTTNSKTTTIATNYLDGIQEIISPEGRRVAVIFDINTYLPKAITRAGEISTHYTYNPKNQLTRVHKGLRDIKYTYDQRGNIASLTDSLGNKYYYDYDIKDRVISIQNPNNQITYFLYDENNNMIKLT